MPLVIDDFTRSADAAAAWTAFTDQVMGGQSEGSASVDMVAGRRALRLVGTVSLEDRGGFVQMARPLEGAGTAEQDATGFGGLALTVCGTPGTYFVHLRTADTRAPWQHYSAELPVSAEWKMVFIPWTAFRPVSLRAPLDITRLVRLGIVAGRTAFRADVSVAEVAFVP
jgi:hypothetical protein